jgi:hypothetical protein
MRTRVTLSIDRRRCPSCGSDEIVRSRRCNPIEFVILPLLLLRPFRCYLCEARHYGFFFRKRATSKLGAAEAYSAKA